MRSCFAAATGWISLVVLGLSALSPLSSAQDLTIASTHTGTFLLGQTNAFYLLRVKNVGAAPSSGFVSVAENAPAGLTVTSVLGDGWTCTVSSCGRSDALAAGASYPAIMVVAGVAQSAGTSLTNQATVSGGGDTNAANNTASDVTAVVANGYPLACGDNGFGQSAVPAGLSGVVAIAASGYHSLALKSDGTVVAWSDYLFGDLTPPAGLSNVVAISGGVGHSLALKSDGTVVAWGENWSGVTTVPVGLSNVVAIASSSMHSLALKSDGTVVAWGDNINGQATVPAGLSDVVAIGVGWGHSLAVKSDGTVVAWGYSYGGGATVPAGLSGVVAVAAGEAHSLALKSDGTVVAWGDDSSGQTSVPADLSGVVAIGVGWNHSLALKSDGTVVAWGSNSNGQATMPAGLSDVVAIAAGYIHSLVLLGVDSKTIPVTFAESYTPPGSPLTIDGVSYPYDRPRVVYWTIGSSHTIGTSSPVAIDADRQWPFVSWSDGGAITHTVAPTTATTYTASFKEQDKVITAANPPAEGSISPATGFFDAGSSVQITATPNAGYIFAGFSGGLTGATNPQNLAISGPTTVTANFTAIPVTDLSITSTHTGTFLRGQTNALYLLHVSDVPLGVPSVGTVTVTENAPPGLTVTSMSGLGWSCSDNSCTRSDSLGAGLSYPAIVVLVTVAGDASTSLTNQATVSGGGDTNAANNTASDVTAVAANGYPVAWGYNLYGQATVPAGLSNVVAIAAGNAHNLALKSDGTVVAWGNTQYGATTVPDGLSNVVAVVGGSQFSLAVKSDGTVVAWGDNQYGATDVPAGLTNVVAVAAGEGHSLALKSDGTVVAWGKSGLGETTVPSGLSNVVAVAAGWNHSLALNSDGTVVAWGGYNYFGQTNVPAGLSGVVAIGAGIDYSLALKSDGTVVAWGSNYNGQTNVPAGLSGVVAIADGQYHTLALKSDGTVVAWGDNIAGGTDVPEGLSNVAAIAAGYMNSLVLLGTAPSIIPVTIAVSAPPGPDFSLGGPLIIDGASYYISFVLDWMPGSSHTIGTASQISVKAGAQYAFTGWSDGGAITHTVSPTTAATYTANFKLQYLITTAANPPAGGSISPATGFFDAGSSVQISATPGPGYGLSGFSGDLAGTVNPQSLLVNAPKTVTANFAAPGLSIVKSHAGNFTQSQKGARYLVTVSNKVGVGTTSGTVTVTETIPGGLGLVSMAGAGWNCPAGGNTCTRGDALLPGASYPAITAVVNVADNAISPQVNRVNVSGGGGPPSTASDPTTILPATTPAVLSNSSFELGSTSQTSFTGTGNGGMSAASWWYTWNNNPGTTKTELCTALGCPSGSVPPAPADGAHTMHVTTTGAYSGVYQIFPNTALTSASIWLRVVSGTVLIELAGPAGTVVRAATGTGVVSLPTNRAIFNEIVLYSYVGAAEFYADAVKLSASAPPPPDLSQLSPNSGPVGTSVTITGTGFGATQGGSTIAFNGTAATPSAWSDTSIEVPVPSGATTGNVVVKVNALASNGLNFTVTPRIVTNPSFETGSSVPVSFTGTYNGGAAAATGWGIWNNRPGTTMTELCTATACPSGSVPPAPVAGTYTLHVTTTGASSGVYQLFQNIGLEYGSLWLSVVSGAVSIEMLGPGGPIVTTTNSSGATWLSTNGAVLNEIVLYSATGAPTEFYVDAVALIPSTGIVANSSFEAGSPVAVAFTGTGNGGAAAATGWGIWNNRPGTTMTELCTATACPSGSVPPAPVAGTYTLHVTTTGASSGVYHLFQNIGLEYGSLWLSVVSGAVSIEMLGPGGPIIKTASASSSGAIWLPANGAVLNEVVLYSSGGAAEFYADAVTLSPSTSIVANPSFELGSATQVTFTGTGNGGAAAATGWNVWNNVLGTTKTELCTATACPSGSVPPTPVAGTHTMHVSTTGASSGVYQIFPKTALEYGSLWLNVVKGTVLAEMLGPAGAVTRTTNATGAVWLPTNGALISEIVLYSSGSTPAEFYVDALAVAP